MAVISTKVLIPSKEMETAATVQYPTPASTVAIIDKFTATNTSVSAAVITVHIRTNAGSTANNNLIIDAKSIAAGETYTFPELIGQVLNAGDDLLTFGTATALTIRCSGREIAS